MSEYLCNLLIPGAPKSGTGSLFVMLSQHPEICVSSPRKEPQFFSFDERFKLGASHHNRNFAHGSGPYRYYLEASQCYFAHEWAIQRITDSLNRPKIILILRDPIERAISHYNWNFRRGVETAPLEAALKTRGDERGFLPLEGTDRYDAVGGFLAYSRYSVWVPRWRETFGAGNLLVLRFDDVVKNPRATANRCAAFLGLQPFSPKPQVRNATNATFRTIAPAPFRVMSKLVPQGLKERQFYKSARALMMDPITPKPERVSEATRAYLEEQLADEIRFFESV